MIAFCSLANYNPNTKKMFMCCYERRYCSNIVVNAILDRATRPRFRPRLNLEVPEGFGCIITSSSGSGSAAASSWKTCAKEYNRGRSHNNDIISRNRKLGNGSATATTSLANTEGSSIGVS